MQSFKHLASVVKPQAIVIQEEKMPKWASVQRGALNGYEDLRVVLLQAWCLLSSWPAREQACCSCLRLVSSH